MVQKQAFFGTCQCPDLVNTGALCCNNPQNMLLETLLGIFPCKHQKQYACMIIRTPTFDWGSLEFLITDMTFHPENKEVLDLKGEDKSILMYGFLLLRTLE